MPIFKFSWFCVIFFFNKSFPFLLPAGLQLEWGRGRLFENYKKCSDFGKKYPDCINLCVKFFIQNLVLREFWRQKFKVFPCGAIFSCAFWRNLYRTAQIARNFPCPKIFLVPQVVGMLSLYLFYPLQLWSCNLFNCQGTLRFVVLFSFCIKQLT